jgi:extracellular factor (EF) 3-hydroxypalmitic acid methyl ester biosynthesis protein
MQAARSDAPLDAALEGLRQGRAEEALSALVTHLASVRRDSSPEAWGEYVARVRNHPIREEIHRDPFALRCYSKPRGYTPDATALDFVLRARDLPVKSRDPLGSIHHFTTNGQLARALRFRRDAIAREIDRVAGRSGRPARVFAAGAGHLRECDTSAAMRDGRVSRFVAFDMDNENLDGIRRDYPALPIVAHHGTVRQIAEGRHLFGDMDLVYSSGLLETLPHPAAVGLARALYAMLAPGGTLFLTHFLPGLQEVGFLEAFLDWRMVYRNPTELFDLVKELPPETVSTWVYSENTEGTIGVLSIQKR